MLAASAELRAEKVATMPAPAAYVDDYAGALSPEAKAQVETMCRQVHDRTKAQIFVVTIHTLEGAPVEQFANELFHNWKIGEKKTDRGLLLLFSIDDRKRWIEVGSGLEGILNDAKVGDIGREMVPLLRAQKYDGAVELGVERTATAIAADAGAAIDPFPTLSHDAAPPAPENVGVPSSQIHSGRDGTVSAILFLIFFGVMGLIFVLAWRGRRLGGGGYSSTGGGFDSGSSSSFDSGSSSSDSFSGGDGGSSGGGGAGGDW